MAYMLADIPDKIYYTISEVSEFTGVESHVLRYWETKFSKLSPKRVGGNQRKYTRKDLELIFLIIDLLYNEGFTLEGAEKKLKEGLPGKKAAIKETNKNGKISKDLSQIKKELQSLLELIR